MYCWLVKEPRPWIRLSDENKTFEEINRSLMLLHVRQDSMIYSRELNAFRFSVVTDDYGKVPKKYRPYIDFIPAPTIITVDMDGNPNRPMQRYDWASAKNRPIRRDLIPLFVIILMLLAVILFLFLPFS